MSKRKKIIAIILGGVIVTMVVLMLIFWPTVTSLVSSVVTGKSSQGSSANSASNASGSSSEENSSGVSPWFSSFVQSVQQFFGGAKDSDKSEDSPSTNPDESATAKYLESVAETQDEVFILVEAGDESSIAKADQLVDEEIRKAEESGNETYIVSAYLAKAALLIDTDRAQEALDTILLPFEQKYHDNEDYIYDIYGYISSAYRVLGNTDKEAEYFNKLPEHGWDE